MKVQEVKHTLVPLGSLPVGTPFVRKCDLDEGTPSVFIAIGNEQALCLQPGTRDPTVDLAPSDTALVLRVTIVDMYWRPGAP